MQSNVLYVKDSAIWKATATRSGSPDMRIGSCRLMPAWNAGVPIIRSANGSRVPVAKSAIKSAVGSTKDSTSWTIISFKISLARCANAEG